MGTIATKAWVLYADPTRGEGLMEEDYSFEELNDREVLVEPIYGCWEANMSHALERLPVNIALLRREERVVLGNSGVVRVLRVGSSVQGLREGDACLFCGIGQTDSFGYIKLVHAYDHANTIGLLAKRSKVPDHTLVAIRKDSPFSLAQWAAFSVRYTTAWSNWKVALGAFRLQVPADEMTEPFVWGWGGGTTFAELDLARRFGCATTMISASPKHMAQISARGIDVLDRREFADLQFDPDRWDTDRAYRNRYARAEQSFLRIVKEKTRDFGVSIFVDYIGTPVYRASLRALGRQGVITTAGWKHGMDLPVRRATECIKRHVHVFTHGARLSEVHEAMAYAHDTGWMPEVGSPYRWSDIPRLVEEFQTGQTADYFPIFAVNPE